MSRHIAPVTELIFGCQIFVTKFTLEDKTSKLVLKQVDKALSPHLKLCQKKYKNKSDAYLWWIKRICFRDDDIQFVASTWEIKTFLSIRWLQCVDPENIHITPIEGIWFEPLVPSGNSILGLHFPLKVLSLRLPSPSGISNDPPRGEVWIFSGTTHSLLVCLLF